MKKPWAFIRVPYKVSFKGYYKGTIRVECRNLMKKPWAFIRVPYKVSFKGYYKGTIRV